MPARFPLASGCARWSAMVDVANTQTSMAATTAKSRRCICFVLCCCHPHEPKSNDDGPAQPQPMGGHCSNGSSDVLAKPVCGAVVPKGDSPPICWPVVVGT